MSQASSAAGVQHLGELGFTELEAAVYVYLVEHSPATAYRVAHGIGKPVANTYKAVESLREKGAVIVDGTGSRVCRAVPPRDLLRKFDSAYRARRSAAAAALARLRPATGDEGIYALTSVDDVMATAASMLKRSRSVVLIDAFPGVVEDLRELLEATAARDVRVSAHVYGVVELEGVETLIADEPSATLGRWAGQWLCLIVDGSEFLFAYLDDAREQVHQAIWSRSALIAWVQHSYLADAMTAAELGRLVRANASRASLEKALARAAERTPGDMRGLRELMSRLAAADGDPAPDRSARSRSSRRK